MPIKRTVVTGLLLLLAYGQAAAGLMLYPTRAVFEGNQRTAQIQMFNDGTESETYRITLVNRRMSENGKFIAIETPEAGERFADRLLRYSPRQVTLQPKEGQTVRIMVRKPADLAQGEYRSHLLFARQPDPQGRTSVESLDNQGSKDAIGIQLHALVGASIPVIVRHGRTEARAALSGLELRSATEERPAFITLYIERSGNQSLYGDLKVSFLADDGTEQVLAQAGGVAVYTPNPRRLVRLALRPQESLRLDAGVVRVVYRERGEDTGRVLAKAELRLP